MTKITQQLKTSLAFLRTKIATSQSDLSSYREWGVLETGVDYSFAQEAAVVEALVDKFKMTSGYLVDIGASDGYSQSSTLGLYLREAWKGLSIEWDPKKFSKLAYLLKDMPGASTCRAKVTPINVANLLKAFDVPTNFELLNIDIDSYDLQVIQSLVESGYRPKIITMEINEKIPIGIFFSVSYSADHAWRGDHFYGCSLSAAVEVLGPLGYTLTQVIYNNAVFISQEVTKFTSKVADVERAFLEGYLGRDNVSSLFPWNRDVEHWHGLSTDEALTEIGSYFSKYRGQFRLQIIQN